MKKCVERHLGYKGLPFAGRLERVEGEVGIRSNSSTSKQEQERLSKASRNESDRLIISHATLVGTWRLAIGRYRGERPRV